MRCSRRQVIFGFLGLTAGGAALVRFARPEGGTEGDLRDSAKKGALEAAIERILPGAVGAGVSAYIAGWLRRDEYIGRVSDEFERGAALLDAQSKARFGALFSAVESGKQDELLGAMQRGELNALAGKEAFGGKAFFEHLTTLTIEGFLSDPKYGGNRDQVGWRFIGFKPCWWSKKLHAGTDR